MIKTQIEPPPPCDDTRTFKSKFLVRLHGEYNILIKLCGNTT